MSGYFKLCRRGFGVVTLLVACVFAVECAGRTQGDWDMICPADWEYVRYFAIAPLTLLSAWLLLSKTDPNMEPPIARDAKP